MLFLAMQGELLSALPGAGILFHPLEFEAMVSCVKLGISVLAGLAASAFTARHINSPGCVPPILFLMEVFAVQTGILFFHNFLHAECGNDDDRPAGNNEVKSRVESFHDSSFFVND